MDVGSVFDSLGDRLTATTQRRFLRVRGLNERRHIAAEGAVLDSAIWFEAWV